MRSIRIHLQIGVGVGAGVVLELEFGVGVRVGIEDRTGGVELIKNKIKFSSHIGKFRVEQLQGHI